MLNKEIYELTNPQKSIWLTEQYYDNTNINNICCSAYIKQKLDFEKLKEAINIMIKNNDSFNLRFTIKDNTIKQYLNEYKYCDVEIIDIINEKKIYELEKDLCEKVFKVENNRLYDFRIFKLPNNYGGFIMNIHHLLSDSWSHGFAYKEVIRIYNNLINNNLVNEEKRYSYLDYISKENEYLISNSFNKDKEYWDKIFETVPEVATIPSTKENSLSKENSLGKRKIINLSKDLTTKINYFCKENKISVYIFFMAIYSIYIGRVSNLDDFVIGTPILNRTNFVEKYTTGMFANTLPMRITTKAGSSFMDFAKKLANQSISMFRHQKYPYQKILEEIRKIDPNIPNLYNILLSYQITKVKNECMNYKCNWCFNGNCAEDMQIHIFDINDTGSLNIAYDYKTQKYKISDIMNMHNRILYIIEQVLNDSGIKTDCIEIVTPSEKYEILNEFNNTKTEYFSKKTIIDLFENQVKKTPNNIAVVFESEKLTYRELNEKANSLAAYLIENQVKNEIVGIMINRSLEMIVAILAVLKSNNTYIPIDPSFPKDRIEYMLKNSRCKALLSKSTLMQKVEANIKTIDVNFKNKDIFEKNLTNLEIKINGDDLAYIIYTSGSTGKPKGVMLKHKSLMNLTNYCNNNIEYLKDNKYRTIVSVTTVSFDIFIFETLISLQRGLKLVIASEDEQVIPRMLNDLIEKENIEIIQTTPSRMQILVNKIKEIPMLNNLKFIILAGEQLPYNLVKKLKNVCNPIIYNGYGPSETTVFSTLTDVTEKDKITIGKPLDNTQIYILNSNMQICPIGVPGEIYISGDGVGKGYIGNKELTDKSFLNNNFIPNSIMYKTGDIGKYNENGEITCMGRIDHQIKIRGLRIELDEIQEIIEEDSNIKKCVVAKQKLKDGHEALCAYIVGTDKLDFKAIRKRIREKLPLYMIPQYFIEVDELPYTLNGKVDRRLLKLPDEKIILEDEKIIYRNKTDSTIAKLVGSKLKLTNINMENSFLELGGDSLAAINLSVEIYNKLKIQVSVKDILNFNSLFEFSDYIDNCIMTKKYELLENPKMEKYPLSSAQKRIYYSSKMIGNDNLVYNLSGALLIRKVLDKAKVERIFNQIISKNSSLRTNFIVENDSIYQKINENVKLKIESFENNQKEIKKLVDDFAKPFDLEKDNLLRIELHFIENRKTLLLIDSHHIVMDGTSLNILLNEFIRMYNDEPLDDKKIEYTDYTIWENNYFKTKEYKKIEDYWINKFKNTEFNSLNLPYDFNVPAIRSYNGNKITKNINRTRFKALEEYARKLGVSPYMLFLSAFYILLYKYTGQEEITLGSPVANREWYEAKYLIGMFVNNIVTKAKINSMERFNDFVIKIKEQVLEDLENQAYPYDELVKKLNVKRDDSQNPLFDVMFIYQNAANKKFNIEGEKVERLVANSNISKFNLSLEIDVDQNSVNLEYSTALFKKETIERLYYHYINLLEYILDNEDSVISDIEILGEEEKNKVLYEFNNTKSNYEKNKTITQLFENQVEKTPNKIAIIFENKKLTYLELNEKANQLANHLRKKGIKPNEIVGIMINRSLELIVSMLGVLKAGGTYLPIDPTYPNSRIEYMINDSKVKTILTSNAMKYKISNVKNIICTDLENNKIYKEENKENLTNVNNPEDVAYILYTSGSTGKPKGVQVTHRNVNNFINGACNKIKFKKTIVSVTTFCFDIFVVESLLPLQKGITIVLANEQEQNIPKLLNEICVKNDVKMINTTPARMQLLLSDGNLEYLKKLECIMLSGEQFPINLLLELQKRTNARIYDMYGPTETTVWSTGKELTKCKEITIGRPVANTQIYILDKEEKLVPIGVPGKMFIGGDGVTNGYLNREELTKEKFRKNPYNKNEIIYDTGDICKWNDDGEIICLGRADFQVKVRGLRIELEEIENKILEFPKINKAIVSVKEDTSGRQFICGYYTAKDRISLPNLRGYLKRFLPNYMIPSHFIQLAEFKYTPNGKIDRKSLPMPEIVKEDKEVILPETKSEIIVANLFEKLLTLTPISINDNFFEIGGDSILALRLQIELMNLGVNISFSDIYKYNTVKQLGLYMDMSNLGENNNSKFEVKEDFSVINKFIEKQNEIDLDMLEQNEIGNVLLTGATGFLGAHILVNLIENTNSKIYCLIRENSKLNVKEKLLNRLEYYFGNKYNNLIDKKIFVIKASVEEKDLGITKNIEDLLNNNVSCVINSAANVKHYGYYSEFESINVKSVQNLIDFCNKYKKKFVQISTVSVSGNALFDLGNQENNIQKDIIFKENNLYVGQSLENVYIRSKFYAEKLVLENVINNNLDALILRIGNVTNRSLDGKFQPNENENAFVNRIKAFLELESIPEYMTSVYAEFSPVDDVADAIVKSIIYRNKKINILHIYNPNHVYLRDLVALIPDEKIKIIDNEEFEKILNNKLKDENSKEKISHIINDLNKDKKLIYESNIKIDNFFTRRYLEKIGFKWSSIDKKYIKNLLKNIGGNNK